MSFHLTFTNVLKKKRTDWRFLPFKDVLLQRHWKQTGGNRAAVIMTPPPKIHYFLGSAGGKPGALLRKQVWGHGWITLTVLNVRSTQEYADVGSGRQTGGEAYAGIPKGFKNYQLANRSVKRAAHIIKYGGGDKMEWPLLPKDFKDLFIPRVCLLFRAPFWVLNDWHDN